MSAAPVDVLRWIDDTIQVDEREGLYSEDTLADGRNVRAAVAELMERMDAYAHATSEIRKCPPYETTPGHILHAAVHAQAEMFEALARCKGAAP